MKGVITPENPMANGNGIVEYARRGHEEHDKEQRIDDRPVMSFDRFIQRVHENTPGIWPTALALYSFFRGSYKYM